MKVTSDVVKCSFEYLCRVVHHTCRQHNVGVAVGTIKKMTEEYLGSATPGRKKLPLGLVKQQSPTLIKKKKWA